MRGTRVVVVGTRYNERDAPAPEIQNFPNSAGWAPFGVYNYFNISLLQAGCSEMVPIGVRRSFCASLV